MVLLSGSQATEAITEAVPDFDIGNHKFEVPQKDTTLAGPDGIPAWEKSQVHKSFIIVLLNT